MTLTKIQLRRAARAARELASDIVEGRSPELTPAQWCGCAAGHIVKRAGLPKRQPAEKGMRRLTALWLDDGTIMEHGWLTWATSEEVHYTPGALVFPLLAFADELDNARASAPTAVPGIDTWALVTPTAPKCLTSNGTGFLCNTPATWRWDSLYPGPSAIYFCDRCHNARVVPSDCYHLWAKTPISSGASAAPQVTPP